MGRPVEKSRIRLKVNGEERELLAPAHHTLLEVLREELGLTGTKHGCELGECGTCAVLVDGRPVLSCVTLPIECEGREITTVEGLAAEGGLHPLQQAFAELGAAQCGYCTGGNLCRCTGYLKIFEAIERAAARMRGEPDPVLPQVEVIRA
jgi:aerobic-type carbon monoxide dehydrogenase small subunit (CoxS/CutS family)